MAITYAYPVREKVLTHRHYYTLELDGGVIWGVCKCGARISYKAILERINQ